VGRASAHQLVEKACRLAIAEKIHLRAVLTAMPEVREYLTEADVEQLLQPHNYLGSTAYFLERVLRRP
jgi:3-carboxy-cis,cis-muconate cycloisomerase